MEAVVEIKEDKNPPSPQGHPIPKPDYWRVALSGQPPGSSIDAPGRSGGFFLDDFRYRSASRSGWGYVIPLVQPGVLDLSLRTAYKEYDGTSFAVTQIDFENVPDHGSLPSWVPLTGNPPIAPLPEVGLGFEKVESYNSILFDASANFLTLRLGLTHEQSTGIARSLSSVVLSSNLSSVPILDREAMGGFAVHEKAPILSLSNTTSINLGKKFGWGEMDLMDQMMDIC